MSSDAFSGSLLLYVIDDSIEELVSDLADDMWPQIFTRLWFERWADERDKCETRSCDTRNPGELPGCECAVRAAETEKFSTSGPLRLWLP